MPDSTDAPLIFQYRSTPRIESPILTDETRIRLSEVVSALSYALDLTEGQPIGHAVKSCVLGMRLVKKSVNQDDPGTYHLFYADAERHPGTDLTEGQHDRQYFAFFLF